MINVWIIIWIHWIFLNTLILFKSTSFYKCSCYFKEKKKKMNSLNEFLNIKNGSRKKSLRKKSPPDLKPNPIPSLTLTLPLTSHGELFSGGLFFWHHKEQWEASKKLTEGGVITPAVREFYLKSVKHDNPDLRKAIKVAQRAFKRSIDDPAGWKHKITKEGSDLFLLVVNICYQM